MHEGKSMGIMATLKKPTPESLGGRGGVERPARAVPGAHKVDRPDLGWVGEGVGVRVHDDRVWRPTRPELRTELQVLIGPVIALIVVVHSM